MADKAVVGRLLKTARGQIDGVMKMVEEDRYCMNILHQIMAAQAVLRRAEREILEGHLRGCVSQAFESVDEKSREEKIQEVVELLTQLTK